MSGRLGGTDFADEQAAGRDHDFVVTLWGERHEGSRSVFGIDQRGEEREPFGDPEQVEGTAVAKLIDGSRPLLFVVDALVAAGEAVEPIAGVQSQQIDGRVPFENVRVEVEFVAGDDEGAPLAIGELPRLLPV